MRVLTSHWDLKLVALVLAIALWIYTSGQVRSDRTVDVDIKQQQISGLGEGYQITSIIPEQFRVTLSVPSNRWASLPGNDQISPRLEVRQDALLHHEQEFALTSAMLGLPSDIRIVRTEPENLRAITVHWEAMAEIDLPVDRPLVSAPAGMEAELHLDIDQVPVRAPRDVLERERNTRVRFQPIDLRAEDALSTTRRHIVVQLREAPNLPFQVVRVPTATVDLIPVPHGRRLEPLPVRVLLPPQTTAIGSVLVSPPSVALTVRGPENLLADLDPDAVVPYVELDRLPTAESERDVPVRVIAPSWLTCDPVSVHLRYLPAAAAVAPARAPTPAASASQLSPAGSERSPPAVPPTASVTGAALTTPTTTISPPPRTPAHPEHP